MADPEPCYHQHEEDLKEQEGDLDKVEEQVVAPEPGHHQHKKGDCDNVEVQVPDSKPAITNATQGT